MVERHDNFFWNTFSDKKTLNATNLEAVMDDGLARAEDVMSSQRALNARVGSSLKIITSSRPREVSFLFATFSLDTQRKSRSLTQSRKKFCDKRREKQAATDGGLARAMSVMRIQRATQRCGWLKRWNDYRQRPREVPFSFVTFLLGKQKKSLTKP